jgi:hypothetical protein
MCYAWDGRVDYEGYLKLVGDVFIKLGRWVQKSYMNELVTMELCRQAVELLNEIQERLFFAFYDERAVKLVVPVLKRFIDGDYPYEDFDYDLTNLMRFVDELQGVLMLLHPLSRQINMEKAEEEMKKASSEASGSDELPF